MKTIIYFSIATMILFLTNCTQEEIDTEYPNFDENYALAYPQNCDTIQRGETFTLRARFTDNVALGGFSIDLHNNFDHHTHSTEGETCEQDNAKLPVNPFVYIYESDIPEGSSTYNAEIQITIPADVDTGDYHLMIRLADAEGWQTLKGLSVKIK